MRAFQAVLLIGALCLSACRRDTTSHGIPNGAAAASSSGALDPALGAPLYDLTLALVDQDGRERGLDVFRGHPVMVSMFYSSCPYACPTLISEIQRIEQQLSPKDRADTRVLLVSFDPERDSSQRLKALSRERHADPSRWIFAHASAEDVRLLVAALGVKYKRLDNGAFDHSSVITVLDQRGIVRARSDGLGREADARLIDVISSLSRG